MGIFSSKTTKYSSASFYELMENEASLPATIKASILGSVLRGRGATSNVLNDILNGPPVMLQRLFKLAKNNKYPYGLPSSLTLNKDNIEASFEAWLTTHVGAGVTIEYAEYGPFNERHNTWKELIETYSYDETTNTLNAAPLIVNGYTQYVQDMIAVLDGSVPDSGDPLEPYIFQPHDPASHAEWEIAAKDRAHPWRASYPGDAVQTSYDPSGTTGAHVDVIWSTTGLLADVVVQRIFIDTDEGDPDDEFFQAKYYYDDGSGVKPYYFTYDGKSGTYPELDALVDLSDAADIAEFMPFLHLRSDSVDLTDPLNVDAATLKETKRMFDLLGIDMNEMADQLNSNDFINDIVQSAVGFYFKLNTSSFYGRKYIFHFFKWLFDQGFTNTDTMNSVITEDELLRLNLRFKDITYTGVVAGAVAPLGEYTVTITTDTVTEDVYYEGNPIPETVSYDRKGIALRYQVTATEYEEYFVEDINMLFAVPGKPVSGTLSDFGGVGFNILVPVSRVVVDLTFKFNDREKVYYASLGLLITTFKKTKLEWYQRPEFLLFIQAVAIVLAVVSLGASLKAAVAGQTTLVGVVSAVSLVIIQFIGVGIIVDFAFKLVIKELGEETGAILAILAIVAGGTKMIRSGTFTNPNANALLRIGNVGANTTQNALNDEIRDIYNDMARYQEEYEVGMAKIEDKQEELGLLRETLLDPNIILDRSAQLMDPNESVSLWLDKGIHTGNIGTLVLSFPEQFVNIMLDLPKFDHKSPRN
jgi:hypothetical protein